MFMKLNDKKVLLIWGLRIAFLVQLLVLVYFNLTHLKYIVDFDGSVPVAQAMEIWKQKRIFIHDWGYQTTMGLDSPVLLAALLYGVTGNGCLAYGMANIIWILLLLLVINDIYTECEIRKEYRYVGFVLLLTPYTMGNLGYMPVLFTGPAFYLVKVFIAVLCFDILLKMHKGILLKKVLPLCGVLLILVMLSGISSGIYVLISGIFPMLVCEWLYVVKENDWKKAINPRVGLLALVIVGFVIGLMIQKHLGFASLDSVMTLMYEGGFIANIGACVVGILELFGAVPGADNIKILSLQGISYLSGFAIVVILFITLVFCIRKCTKEMNYFLMWGWVAFACNMVVLILANTCYGGGIFEARYQIFTMLPLVVILPKYLENIKVCNVLPQTIIAGVVFSVLVVNYTHYREYYACDNFYDSIEQVVDMAKEQGADALVVLGEDMITTGRIARLCDSNMPVIVYATWDNVLVWGGSTLRMGDYPAVRRYVVLTGESGYNGVGDEIKGAWKPAGTMESWQMYIGSN